MHEIHLDTVDSTNNYAKKHCGNFPKEGMTCIFADEQTAGRGRFQRKWISPKGGNIYCTFYFSLPIDTPDLISLNQVVACSLVSLFQREDLHPKIKWPNDIQIQGKKISGILCETQFHPNRVDVFLGIGINLDNTALKQVDQPATSLFLETGKKWEISPFLKKLQRQIESDLEIFKRDGFAPFYSTFDHLLALKGETVRCYDGQKEWVGICHSLTRDGQLNLLLPNQTLHTVSSGDIKPGK